MSEVRRVLLANGQYIEIVQETGASTGSVMSQSAVTAALNGKANTTHTHAASDITSGAFGSARIADGAITRAKLASDVPISVTQYETVTVTGVCSDGSSIAGKQLSIGGFLCEFDSNGVVSANIPYGQAYTIRPIVTNLYFSNDFYTFTAATTNRSVAVSYTVGCGIYIEDKQGRLYTESDWSSGNNTNANSIAVVTDAHSFRIALTGPSSYMTMSNSSEDPWKTYLSGTTNSGIIGEGVAMMDYNGATNTQLIVTKCNSSTGYAAGWCNAYTFPDGKTKGYLPALGELCLVSKNNNAIDAALAKCGGTALYGGSYWSSTFYGYQSGESLCWTLDWYSSQVGRNILNIRCYIRAFGAY